MGSANERRCYYVTPSLIGQVHTLNDPLRKDAIGVHMGYMETVVVIFLFNTLNSEQYGQHFADEISICIFTNEKIKNSHKMSLRWGFFCKSLSWISLHQFR